MEPVITFDFLEKEAKYIGGEQMYIVGRHGMFYRFRAYKYEGKLYIVEYPNTGNQVIKRVDY